jgi:hypothetical protein
MKIIPVILFYIISLTLDAATYYVATTSSTPAGNDANAGTILAPWATWQKAFNTAIAGDTVYFRGGVWYPKTPLHGGVGVDYNPPTYGHNGTHDDPICYFNYTDEVPILDFDSIVIAGTTGRYGLNISAVTYVKFQGLTVRNLKQDVNLTYVNAIDISNSGVIWLDRMVSCYNWGAGYFIKTYDTLYLTNCDAYFNIDSLPTNTIGNDGGHADGFNVSSGGTATDTFRIAYINGCRAWKNSDDAFDIGSTKQFQISNCWAWGNGGLDGDGTGFKYSYSNVLTASKRTQRNCITAYNTMTESDMGGGGYTLANYTDVNFGPYLTFYNNSSYKDYIGFFDGQNNYVCNDSASVICRNNIVYAPTNKFNRQGYWGGCGYVPPTYLTYSNNTWILSVGEWWTSTNTAYTVTAADFISLDTAQLDEARQANGSLPEITFMRLASTSDLIDAGTYVGLDTVGSNADIGYAEYGTAADYGPPAEVATSITELTTNLWINGATLHGNCNDDGGGTVSDKGICWGTSANPTTSGSHYHAGAGTGAFSTAITGMVKSTTYHIRAFATNEAGTAYSADATFVTPAESFVGSVDGSTLMQYNGQLYKIE